MIIGREPGDAAVVVFLYPSYEVVRYAYAESS